MVLYHITPLSNINSIRKNGLQPRIGGRSLSAGETTPAIYMFANMEDLEQALLTWAGDEFEDEEIAILKIQLLSEYEEFLSQNDYEITCRTAILPQYIQFLNEKIFK